MNTFKKGRGSKESLTIGLTKREKQEGILNLTEKTLNDNIKKIGIRRSISSSRMFSMEFGADYIIKENYLKSMGWDFYLKSTVPIFIEHITFPKEIIENNKTLFNYRCIYEIKKEYEHLIAETLLKK